MFIVDFDDTLFDTARFKIDRQAVLSLQGVSDAQYRDSYARARNTPDGNFAYSDERHADILAEMGFGRDRILSALRAFDSELAKYLFPDTIDFLSALRDTGEPMILLSLGDSAFQEKKVKKAGIEKFFDRIFMVANSKEKVIAELFTLNENEYWLINDKIDETVNLASRFADLRAVIKGGQTQIMNGLPVFSTLSEINKYVLDRTR